MPNHIVVLLIQLAKGEANLRVMRKEKAQLQGNTEAAEVNTSKAAQAGGWLPGGDARKATASPA